MHYFFAEAQKRNVKRLINLTQIHTSNEKEWIVAAKKSEQNKYSDRYVLTNRVIEGMEDHIYLGMSPCDLFDAVLNCFAGGLK